MAILKDKEKLKKQRDFTRVQTIAGKYELDEKDAKLLRLALDYPEAPLREFAAAIGTSHQNVHKRMKKPSFKKALGDLLSTNEDLLKRAQTAALRRMMGLVNSTNERIALEASSRLLAAMLEPARGGLNINMPGTVVYRARVGENGALIREAFTVPEGSDIVDVTPGDPLSAPPAEEGTIDPEEPGAQFLADEFAQIAASEDEDHSQSP